MDWIEYIIENVYKYYNNRNIVLWGKYVASELIREKLKEKYGIEIAFFVDKDVSKIDEKLIFPTDCLYGRANELYIVIPLAFYQTLKDELIRDGYEKDCDYFYFSDCIIHQDLNFYEDSHGNKIIGAYSNLKFAFSGFNSIVEIGENVSIQNSTLYIHNNSKVIIKDGVSLVGSKVNVLNNSEVILSDKVDLSESKIDVGNNARIEVGRVCKISGVHWGLYDHAKLKIGDRGWFLQGCFVVDSKAILEIGDSFRIGARYYWVINPFTEVIIGNDCMFSYEVNLISDDGHPIYDLKTGERINLLSDDKNQRKILIGNHVWVGMRCSILYNTNIHDGSIIGACSLVKSIIPNNCMAAGIPAKIIKKNVAWKQ